MVKGRLARLMAGATLVGTLSLPFLSVPASAAYYDCPSMYLCAWMDANYAGARYQFAGNNWTWYGWAIFDNDSSWYNNGTSGMRVQVYRDVGYSSTTVCLAMGQRIASDSYANDKGSSNQWGGC